MGKGVNKAVIIGTVGKDPELRFFQSGDAYCSLSVATSEQWKDKQGEKASKTEWHKVKFTRKLAEIVGEYVKKGSLVYIEGRIETNKFTDKQGVERYSTEIVAHEMQMLGGKKDGVKPEPANVPNDDSDPFGDDLPF